MVLHYKIVRNADTTKQTLVSVCDRAASVLSEGILIAILIFFITEYWFKIKFKKKNIIIIINISVRFIKYVCCILLNASLSRSVLFARLC